MTHQIWHRGLAAAVLAGLVLQLAACGAGDSSNSATVAAGTAPTPAASPAAATNADSSSSELIEAALAKGEIDAEAALSYKVFAVFRDARLPARYKGGAAEEFDASTIEELGTGFDSLSNAAQAVLAPFLLRPADLGSWASPLPARPGGADRPDCMGPAVRWAAITPAGSSKFKVWYDTAVAGDQAIAAAVSNAIGRDIWPRLAQGQAALTLPDDTARAGCDGGDARLDVYLVHGINAGALTVPAARGGANPASAFTLINADAAADAQANASHGLMSTIEYTKRSASSQVNPSGRRQALALAGTRAAGQTTRALAVAAAPIPTVVQAKAASLSAGGVSVTLDRAVTAGNWIAVAVSTVATTPMNVALSDNQGHGNLNFASAGLKYTSSFGTLWRYAKLTGTGTYTLIADRAGATSGTVQILELGNVDPTTFLDIAAISTNGTSAVASSTFRTKTKTANDLLLSVVAVRSGTATISPTAPAGTTLVDSIQNGVATSGVLAFNTSATGTFGSAASLAAASAWRMSTLAIRGAAAPPVVVAPTNTALPVISVTDNSSFLGLSVSQGEWANAPTAYSYGWTRNGALIPGATLASYDTVPADQGGSIAAVVTASNSAGGATATSAAVPVPIPTSPTAPSVALTASPSSIVQGQPSTLAWSSTNATSCTAAGAWSGAKALSGSLAITPQSASTYTLDCVGAGGTATATASVDVTAAPPGSNPTLGAHALVFHRSQGSVGATLPTPAMTTQSGSTLLAFVGKGSVWNLSLPIDNKGNTPYVQIGAIHEYTKWPGEGTAVYAFNSIVGGPNHIVSVDDSNVWDEVTFSIVEVKNGGIIQDYKWNEVLMSAAQTSLSVTTTGPATLVAVWYGDDASSTPANPVPNNGFTVIEGNGNAVESVQMFVATRDVAAAGTYNVTWNTTPLQGAQLYLIAVQRR